MIEITQIVQELTTTAGAWRVAYELMEAFTLQGIPNSVITSRTDLEGSPAHVEVVAPWINHLSAPWPLSYLTHAVVVPLFNLAATSAQRGPAGLSTRNSCGHSRSQ